MNAEELVNKWRHVIEADPIWTWTEPHCLAYCCERASEAQYGVELGTYFGASAAVMLRANPNLHLWCVDHFAVAGCRWVADKMLAPWIKEGRCELIQGDSAKASEMLQHMKGRLDFVWVDDGHATEDVMRDIRSFQPLIKKGGYLFGHDFDVPHNDVALGVIKSLRTNYEIPVPRLWSHQVKGCCGQ